MNILSENYASNLRGGVGPNDLDPPPVTQQSQMSMMTQNSQP